MELGTHRVVISNISSANIKLSFYLELSSSHAHTTGNEEMYLFSESFVHMQEERNTQHLVSMLYIHQAAMHI